MTHHSDILAKWHELAAAENRRMRQNMDGCPWGAAEPHMKRGPKPQGETMPNRILAIIRAEPGILSSEIKERMSLTKKQWENARGHLVRESRIVSVWRSHNDARWEAIE